MFNGVIQNRVNLKSRVPRILGEDPKHWDYLEDLTECLDYFWELSNTPIEAFGRFDRFEGDELVAVIMGFAISDRFDIRQRGLMEAGEEYFYQSNKTDMLLGRFVREQLRAFSVASGTGTSIYPFHSVTLTEIFARAKRAEDILKGFRSSSMDWFDIEEEDATGDSDPVIPGASALSDDELVDCILLSWQMRHLEKISKNSNFFISMTFTEYQLGLGSWIEGLALEYKKRIS